MLFPVSLLLSEFKSDGLVSRYLCIVCTSVYSRASRFRTSCQTCLSIQCGKYRVCQFDQFYSSTVTMKILKALVYKTLYSVLVKGHNYGRRSTLTGYDDASVFFHFLLKIHLPHTISF